ncbi:holo-ACP synthase [bacterium]|nr:holo-ACP synthase [candidate division CSSED10-310 bacterium]
MIDGIGTDIIRISRIKRAMERTGEFEERVFAPAEIEYCRRMARPERHFAARFAAKEAVMKALGTGWSGGLRFQDIRIDRDPNGAPRVTITEPSRSAIGDIDRMHIHVSMSHDGDYAVAIAMIEKGVR